MEEKTDKELYKEFLLGNNKSFEEIVIRHKDSIIYFILLLYSCRCIKARSAHSAYKSTKFP